MRIKELLDQGIIGQLYDITCAEHIGYYHYIMSYVRGMHRSSDQGNSFMIAKGIHDTDLITWLTQSKAKRVSSFGDLSFFNESNAPKGAPARCTDGCPEQENCIFDAIKQYVKPGRPILSWKHALSQDLSGLIDLIKEPRFRTLASSMVQDVSKENILKAIKEREEGKCVFRSQNGVTDHQTTSIEYENGATCSFSLSAFSLLWERLLELRGPKGEIWSRDFTGKLEVRLFYPLKIMKERIRYNGLHHGGGDQNLLLDFANAVKNDDPNVKSMTDVENSLESHLIALAIEEARIEGKVVNMSEFRGRAEEQAMVLANKN